MCNIDIILSIYCLHILLVIMNNFSGCMGGGIAISCVLSFWRPMSTSYFGVTGKPVLDFSWYLFCFFKARVGCPFCFAGANVMFTPWDPPLVLHTASLLMINIIGQQFKTIPQHCHLLTHYPIPSLDWTPVICIGALLANHYTMLAISRLVL